MFLQKMNNANNLSSVRELIVLVHPNYRLVRTSDPLSVSPPLGLLYLAAALEKESIPVHIIDAHAENQSLEQTLAAVKDKRPSHAGFSFMTPAADLCAEMAARLPPGVAAIAGGPHASAVPEETLKAGFDIVVRGEGEATLPEVVRGGDLTKILGVSTMKNGRPAHAPARPHLDPDSLPFPARHLIARGGTDKPYFSDGTRFFPWAPILTSRGCPYSCYFCPKDVHGHAFRGRSPENVVREIDLLVKTYGIRELVFYDHMFNYDRDRAEEILDLIAGRSYRLCLRFVNGLRADRVDERLVAKMKRAGAAYVVYGIESGDPEILRRIPKGETLDQVRRAVRMTKKAGILTAGFFILGLLGDTVQTMRRTIRFAKSLNLDGISLSIATPYPGTRMERIIKEKGGQVHLRKWEDYLTRLGKMPYRLPGMASEKQVEAMFKKALISFYFSPRYILRHAPLLFKPSFYHSLFRGLLRLFSNLKK